MALANAGLKLMAPINTACTCVASPKAPVQSVYGEECPGGEQWQKGSSHHRQTHGNGLEGAPMSLQIGGDRHLRQNAEERTDREENASPCVIAGQASNFEG